MLIDKIKSYNQLTGKSHNLHRWRGSVYKLVWMDLLAYTVIYYTLSLVYRVALTEEEKRLGCTFSLQIFPIYSVATFGLPQTQGSDRDE